MEPTKEINADKLKAIADLPLGQEHKIPTNIKMALSSKDSLDWQAAAEYKINKFALLGVWEQVNP